MVPLLCPVADEVLGHSHNPTVQIAPSPMGWIRRQFKLYTNEPRNLFSVKAHQMGPELSLASEFSLPQDKHHSVPALPTQALTSRLPAITHCSGGLDRICLAARSRDSACAITRGLAAETKAPELQSRQHVWGQIRALQLPHTLPSSPLLSESQFAHLENGTNRKTLTRFSRE